MLCIGSAILFGYQHVGIGNAKSSFWGLDQTRGDLRWGGILAYNCIAKLQSVDCFTIQSKKDSAILLL